MGGGQRLGGEHVEGRAREVTGVEGRQEIGLDQVLAAADLDQEAARAQAGKEARIENAARLRRQRQQVHQDFRLTEHRREPVEPVVVDDAGIGVLRAAAPGPDREAEGGEIGGDPPADPAVAEDADRHRARVARVEPAPEPVALVPGIRLEAPLVADGVPEHEARHRPRLVGIDHPHHRQVRRPPGTGEQVVDPGRDRAESREVGVAGQRVGRRAPGQGQAHPLGVLCRMIQDLDPVGNFGEYRAEQSAQVGGRAQEHAGKAVHRRIYSGRDVIEFGE